MEIALIFLGISFAALAGLVFVWLFKKKKYSKIKKDIKKKGNKGWWVLPLYRLYIKTPIIKKYFRKIYKSVEITYPADEFAINRKATQVMSSGIGLFLLCVVFSIVTCKGDFLYALSGAIIGYIILRINIEGKLKSMEHQLLNQFSDFIDDVRYYYFETNAVDTSIYSTLDNVPYEVGLHVNKMYQVLTSTDVDFSVEEYANTTPNRFMLTFVSICASTLKYGDKQVKGKISVFINNLKHLKEELNVELLKRRNIDYLFKGTTMLCLLPTLAIKPIELWAISNIPEIATYYKGSYGTIMMFLMLIITLIAFVIVNNLKYGNDGSSENVKTWQKISKIPVFSTILNKQINHNYTKALSYDKDLKLTGSKLGVKGFYAKKVCFALIGILAVFVITQVSLNKEKLEVLNNFSEEYEEDYTVKDDYKENMRLIAQELTNKYKNNPEIQEMEIIEDIHEMDSTMSSSYLEKISGTVISKLDKYSNLYYKWYFLLISLAGGAAGFFIPNVILFVKKKSLSLDMEDEVSQFQSIALILMHVKEATTEIILEWMERFSRCFKPSIQDCLLNIERGEKEALEELKIQEPFKPFNRFVDNLLSIDKVGVESAFDSVEIQREYDKEKRKLDNAAIAQKKAKYARIVSMIPMMLIIFGYLIMPMIFMGIEMLSALDASLL